MSFNFLYSKKHENLNDNTKDEIKGENCAYIGHIDDEKCVVYINSIKQTSTTNLLLNGTILKLQNNKLKKFKFSCSATLLEYLEKFCVYSFCNIYDLSFTSNNLFLENVSLEQVEEICLDYIKNS